MSNNNLSNENDTNYCLTLESFEFLRMVALTSAGINISKHKKIMVFNRLLPRIKALGFSTFEEYCNLLTQDKKEKEKFINLITNPSTTFFREYHHFEFLSQYLPDLLTKKRKIRIWSAGCATGEEAYSIAIIAKEAMQNKNDVQISILATDIDSDCLAIAQKGIYEIDKIKQLNVQHMKQFYRGLEDNQGLVKVKDTIRELITFEHLNLITESNIQEQFDVIFCRNVTIYFSAEITRQVLDKLDKLLLPNGILILGFSENPEHLRHRYESIYNTIYRKRA